ncbi:MAG: DNA-directed RNA polymerase subunit E'' [Candidatus Micrarchaeota archaeon]|nr:DNA-directed RNA polymerase subunit E'' [Candidatus Micrarchaeota archaeon]
MEEKACKSCRLLIRSGDTCPLCGSKSITSKWSSYVIVLNAERSEVAQKLGIKVNELYALNIKD